MKKTFILLQGLLLLAQPFLSFAATLSIDINGVDSALEENISSRLNLDRLHEVDSEEGIQLFYQTAPSEIKKALQPFGYFNPNIQSSLTPQRGDKWAAHFNIQPGTPVRIAVLDIRILNEGANNPLFLDVINKSLLKKGRVFSATEYNALQKGLFAVASDYGYFDARLLKDDLTIDLRNNTANIAFHFDTGKRYRFQHVFFSESPFDISFLKRFIPFSPGEYYSVDKVEKFQEDLTASDYFSEAWVGPLTDNREDGEVPIEASIKPRPYKQYHFGAGYGTDTGIRGSAGIEFRRLTPTGHRLTAQTQASQKNSNFQVAYTIPGANPVTDQFFLTASAETLDESLGDGNLQKFSAGLTSKIHSWQQTLSLSLQRERSALDGEDFFTDYMLLPKGVWEYLSQDDEMRVSRGLHALFTLQGAPALLGNTSFLQGIASVKTIQPLGKNRIIARAAIGYTWINDVANLPLSFQLSAGGAQSVRGYGYNSIGPGSSMVVGSLEYRQRVKDDWYAAFFFDAGSVSNTFLGDIQTGPGVGVVWQSPLGALALSVAHGVSTKSNLIHFSIGRDL